MSDLALHFLSKLKVMVISDIERDEVEFICKVGRCSRAIGCILTHLQSIGCRAVASEDHFVPECLGSAEVAEEISVGSSKVIKAGRAC